MVLEYLKSMNLVAHNDIKNKYAKKYKTVFDNYSFYF